MNKRPKAASLAPTKATEVITMGRSRSRQASSAASTMPLPWNSSFSQKAAYNSL